MPSPLLPPEVYQGMGWPPADPSLAPPPEPFTGVPDFGGLPPTIPAAMGWGAPPPPPESAIAPPPPIPSMLPSMQQQAAPSPPVGPQDYQVPPSAFGGGQPTAAPPARPAPAPAPSRPQTFGQQMQGLQQREAGTEQAQQNAIQAGIDAQKPMHAEDLAAYQQAQAVTEANAQSRRAEQDAYDKAYATNAARVEADRQQIDSFKFNQDKYLDDLGTGGQIRWGIAQILAGIGQGLMRSSGPNPVTAMLQQNIHDANEAQYKQRDMLVQKLGIDRETGKDAAQYHATRQAEIDKADGLAYTALAKKLEMAAVKSADPIAQAAGMKAMADVRAAADDKFKSSIQLQSQHDQTQQQIGIAGGHLALATKQFNAEYGPQGFKQQEMDLRAADEMRKAAADAAKAHKEQLINDPTTGLPMVTSAGQQKLQLADGYEAAARQEKDPAHAAQLNQMAAAYRHAAYASDAALAGDPKKAEAAQKKVNVAQDMSNNVGTARAMLEAGPEAWDRQQWAQVKVALQGVKVNYAQDMGERMSPKALEAIDDVTSIDPDSIWSRTADKGKALAALEIIQNQVSQSANVALRGAGIQANWSPSKPTKSPTFGGQTAREIGDAAEPGLITKYVVNPLAHPIDTLQGNRTPEALKQQAFDEASMRTGTLADGSPGRASNYGLAPEQEATIDQLANRASQAGHAEYGRILDDLSTPLLKISGNKSRPSLALGVASKLHEESPRLFADVLARIAGAPGGGEAKAKEIADSVSTRGFLPVPGGGVGR